MASDAERPSGTQPGRSFFQAPLSKSLWAVLLVAAFLVDVLTKLLAIKELRLWQEVVIIPGFFSLNLTTNRGIAFSLLSDYHSPWKTFLLALAAMAALGFIFHLVWRENQLDRRLGLGLAMVAGGILGNMANRLITGSVIDFLDFHAGAYSWPTFNLADTFISVGAGLIIWDILFRSRHLS